VRSEPVIEAKPRVIMGVHPCDINATWLLDLAFSTDNLDTNYMEKRKKAVIILLLLRRRGQAGAQLERRRASAPLGLLPTAHVCHHSRRGELPQSPGQSAEASLLP